MRRAMVVLGLLLLTAPLAGCLGQEDSEDDEDIQKQRATVTSNTGGIEGVVTDPAVQPIEGANVTIEATNETATTSADGSFAFSKVDPGTYTLRFDGDGFLSAEKTVEVSANDVARVDVILSHTRTAEAFTQTQELVGFIECGAGWSTSPDPLPGLTSNAVALCSVANIGPGNATNDRFSHTFKLEPPIETLIYEMTWDSETTAMSTQVEVQGHPFNDSAEIFRAAQTPTIYGRMDRPVFDELQRNFTKWCEGANGTEPNDAFCGYNWEENGWPLQTRVFASGECNSLPARVCPVIQEEFKHVITGFYNEPAPDGFAVLESNPPS